MTLRDYMIADGCVPSKIRKVQFTGHVVRLISGVQNNGLLKKLLPGKYWIESISRYGNDEVVYFKLELVRDVSDTPHHTASSADYQEIYICSGDFDKIMVEQIT